MRDAHLSVDAEELGNGAAVRHDNLRGGTQSAIEQLTKKQRQGP